MTFRDLIMDVADIGMAMIVTLLASVACLIAGASIYNVAYDHINYPDFRMGIKGWLLVGTFITLGTVLSVGFLVFSVRSLKDAIWEFGWTIRAMYRDRQEEKEWTAAKRRQTAFVDAANDYVVENTIGEHRGKPATPYPSASKTIDGKEYIVVGPVAYGWAEDNGLRLVDVVMTEIGMVCFAQAVPEYENVDQAAVSYVRNCLRTANYAACSVFVKGRRYVIGGDDASAWLKARNDLRFRFVHNTKKHGAVSFYTMETSQAVADSEATKAWDAVQRY